MKQKIASSFLILILSCVGRSQAYGVKGVFGNSYSEASSASAFSSSSSLSSSSPIDSNNLPSIAGNNLAASDSASFTARVSPNSAAAKAGSAAYAGSVAYPGSAAYADAAAYAGTDSYPGSVLNSGSGSFPGSDFKSVTGSIVGAGSYSGTGFNSVSNPGSVSNSGSGLYSGSGLIFGAGSYTGSNSGAGFGSHSSTSSGSESATVQISNIGSGEHSGAGTNSHYGQGLILGPGSPQSILYGKSNADDKVIALGPGAYHSVPGKKECCKTVFPGSIGSIYDSKPADSNSAPDFEGQVNYRPNSIESSSGLTYKLIHSFPGPSGSIHDYKQSTSKTSTGTTVSTGPQIQLSLPAHISSNTGIYSSDNPSNIHDGKPILCSGSSCSAGSHGYQVSNGDILTPSLANSVPTSSYGIKQDPPNQPELHQICSGSSCKPDSSSFPGSTSGVYSKESYNDHATGFDLSKLSYQATAGCSGPSCKPNFGLSSGATSSTYSGESVNKHGTGFDLSQQTSIGCSGPSCELYSTSPSSGAYNNHATGQDSNQSKTMGCSGASCNFGPYECSGPTCSPQPSVPLEKPKPSLIPVAIVYPGSSYINGPTGTNTDLHKPSFVQPGCFGPSCGPSSSGGSQSAHAQTTSIDLSVQKLSPCSGTSCTLGINPAVHICSGPSCGSYSSIPTDASSSGNHQKLTRTLSESDTSAQSQSNAGIDLIYFNGQKPLVQCSEKSCDLGLSSEPTGRSPSTVCSGNSCNFGSIAGSGGCSGSSCESNPTSQSGVHQNSLIDVRNGELSRQGPSSNGIDVIGTNPGYHISFNKSPVVIPIIPATSTTASVGNTKTSSADGSRTYVTGIPLMHTETGDLPPSHQSYSKYDDSKGPSFTNPDCSGNTCQPQLQGVLDSGYATGNVVIQKSDGAENIVVDGSKSHTPSGYGCSGSDCAFHNVQSSGGSNSGSDSGSSGVYVADCFGNECGFNNEHGRDKSAGSADCISKNCGLPILGSGSGSIAKGGAFTQSGASSGTYGGVSDGSGSFSVSSNIAGAGHLKPLGLGEPFAKSESYHSSSSFSRSAASSSVFSSSYSNAAASSF